MRKTSLLFAYFLLSGFLFAQKTAPQPKLIVGIVVDQMRYDFLYRFRDSYGSGGFKRLISEGFSCENTHYNYAPTYTGPGHAAIYTGTTPAVNGIIANDWWDIKTNQNRYVTSDIRYKTIGNPGDEITSGDCWPTFNLSLSFFWSANNLLGMISSPGLPMVLKRLSEVT